MNKLGLIISVGMLACGCGRGDNAASASEESDILAQYRDTVLHLSDVCRLLPPGISSADSARLTASIVDEWIDGFIIEDLAAGQIDDMDRIERLTESYRRSLIADSYRRKMRSAGVQPIDEAGVKAYYRSHRENLRLERPIVKGLFIKVPASSRHLDDIRSWMTDGSQTACDELENIGRKETVNFRYFADRWVDFDAITGEIPYRFGDADRFVASTAYFETEHNGTVYIMHLSDFCHSGGVMPEDYAAPIIEDRIKSNHLADYEKGLIKALRQTAIEKNILTIGNNTR